MRRDIMLFVLLLFAISVSAVPCPPGFNWQRMSGVGCVQDDCAAKGGGYTYTQECWCGEKKRACYEYVNYTALGFDQKQCGAFCPVSKFIGCADANGKCPNDQPTTQTPKECDTNYCISYQGPYAKSIVMNGHCYCSCKEGYTAETNKILLCQPTKATCDQYCKEYHGGDKIHGDSAYGKVNGVDCDCHCNAGYYADKTLVCLKIPTAPPKKDPTCQEVCNKTMGEAAVGSGTYPNCKCDCKGGYTKHNVYDKEWKVVCEKIKCPKNSSFNEEKGRCLCDQGFYMELVDGLCVPLSKPKFCGNNSCDTKVDAQYIENCYSCPEDCKCEAGQVCNPKHAITYAESFGVLNGCVNTVAEIVDIGCADGSGVPPVYVHRDGQPSDAQIRGQRGTKLAVGDVVSIERSGDAGMACNKPYMVFQWGDVRGMMMLNQLPSGIVTIKEDAVSSGWPASIGVTGTGGIVWRIFSLVRSVGTAVPSAAVSWGASSAGEKETVKVYVKSDIVINQSGSGVTIYTIEGGPIVEYKGKNTTVNKGMRVTVSGGLVSTPTNFTASEVGDWFLRIPDPPEEENANANVGDNTTPDLSGITSQLKNTCCGSTAMIGMLLVLAAWGGRKHPEK